MEQLTKLTVEIAEEGADPEDVDATCRKLRGDLLKLDVKTVELIDPNSGPRRDGTKGTKGSDLVAIAGMLLVTFSQSPELIGNVVDTLRAWLGGHTKRRVRLILGQDELELENLPLSEQRRIIEQFLSRHH